MPGRPPLLRGTGCLGGPGHTDATETLGYDDLDRASLPDAAVLASLGCGNPTAVAELRDRVAGLCAERLARFKQPTRIEVVPALPRTVTGKIAKGRLRTVLRREGMGLIE